MILKDLVGQWVIPGIYQPKVFDAGELDTLPPWLDLSGSDTGYSASVSGGVCSITSAAPAAGTDKWIDLRCLLGGGQLDLSNVNLRAVALTIEGAYYSIPPGRWQYGHYDQALGSNPQYGAHFVHVDGGGGSMTLRANNPAQSGGYGTPTQLPGPASSGNPVNYQNHHSFTALLSRQRDVSRVSSSDAWWLYQFPTFDWPGRRFGGETWVQRLSDTAIANASYGGVLSGKMAAGSVWPRISVRTNIQTLGTGLALAATGDTVTKTAHGLLAGTQVTLSAVTGGGIANGLYYVLNPSANTFQLALTVGGSAVDITANGTATVAVNDVTPITMSFRKLTVGTWSQ